MNEDACVLDASALLAAMRGEPGGEIVRERLAGARISAVNSSEVAGKPRRLTRAARLSLGDRACLALARRDGAAALTTDRAWRGLRLEARVELIR